MRDKDTKILEEAVIKINEDVDFLKKLDMARKIKNSNSFLKELYNIVYQDTPLEINQFLYVMDAWSSRKATGPKHGW